MFLARVCFVQFVCSDTDSGSTGLESQTRDAVAKVFSSVGAETVDLDVVGLAGANVTISPDCSPIASCLHLGDQDTLSNDRSVWSVQ